MAADGDCTRMTDRNDLDDPVKKAQIVGLLLKLSPLAFGLCYFLAWIQGAEPRFCLLIAAVGAGMCLGAAGAIQLLGSKSWIALVALKIALLLATKR